MTKLRIRKLSIVFLCGAGAWFLATYSRAIVKWLVGSSSKGPEVPMVAEAPWNGQTGFFSSLAPLGAALLVAMAAAGLVELAKSRLTRRDNLSAYLLFWSFQVLVAWAAFANGAWDWASHFESLILTGGNRPSGLVFQTSGPNWPWLSLLPLAAFATVSLVRRHWLWLSSHPGVGGEAAAGPNRLRLAISILGAALILAVLASSIVDSLYAAKLWRPSLVSVALLASAVFALAWGLWQRRPASSGIGAGEAKAWVAMLLGGAWLLAAGAPWITERWFPPGPRWPHLGNVASVPWSEQAEPRSVTVVLMGALAVALIALVLVELAKLVRIRAFQSSGYVWLLAFQLILLVDLLISSAPDWSAYFLSLALPGSPMVDPAQLPSWPWSSLIALLALLISDQRREVSSTLLET